MNIESVRVSGIGHFGQNVIENVPRKAYGQGLEIVILENWAFQLNVWVNQKSMKIVSIRHVHTGRVGLIGRIVQRVVTTVSVFVSEIVKMETSVISIVTRVRILRFLIVLQNRVLIGLIGDHGHLVITSAETQQRPRHDYVKVLRSVIRDVPDLLKEQNHVKVNVV